MESMTLHPDFKDFLRLLNSQRVEYLLVGGYAVGYHGYPRATGDMDIWIAVNPENARKVKKVFHDFGMSSDEISEDLFLEKDKIIRMGNPPVRLEIITGASGVDFSECYARREVTDIDGIPISFISIDDLKKNKKACGRHKDLADLDNLP